MPFLKTLERRLTHRYIGEYMHMDEWDYIARVSVVHHVTVDTGNGIDIGATRYFTFRLPVAMRDWSLREIRSVLHDSFGYHGCGHDYDCCGCASYSVRHVRRHSRRRISFAIRTSYNY